MVVGGRQQWPWYVYQWIERRGPQMAALTFVPISLDRASRQSSRGTSFLMWRSCRHRRSTWRLRRMETWNGCARSPSSLALPWARCPESPRHRVRGCLWVAERGTLAELLPQIRSDLLSLSSPDVTPATFETPEVHTGTGMVGNKPQGRSQGLEDGDGESATSFGHTIRIAGESYPMRVVQRQVTSCT